MGKTTRTRSTKPRNDIVRVLSIDGGGIYGLSSALWLRMLCERDPSFLDGKEPVLFAGTSSGAVNCLLLARHECPREAVLAGELERFWNAPVGAFSNTNPVTATLSLFQITGWYSIRDFALLLQEYFGDLTLGDLPQRVLINSFNWHGGKPFSGLGNQASDIDPHASFLDQLKQTLVTTFPGSVEVLRGVESEVDPFWTFTRPDTGGDEPRTHWRPKLWHNFPGDEDREAYVVDVAYCAATPPGFRGLVGGVGDGATNAVNPAPHAVAAVISYFRNHGDWLQTTTIEPDPTEDIASHVLEKIQLLSLGPGQLQPNYWLRSFDQSFMQFGMLPTNPLAGVFYAPNAGIMLDAPGDDATYICRQLLGEDSFFRLNPPSMRMPTLMASYYARFPVFRKWITDQIAATEHLPATTVGVERAEAFLKSSGWT